jgi:hypothetical protein
MRWPWSKRSPETLESRLEAIKVSLGEIARRVSLGDSSLAEQVEEVRVMVVAIMNHLGVTLRQPVEPPEPDELKLQHRPGDVR